MNHCHVECEYLLWVRHCLYDSLQVLSHKCLDLILDALDAFIRACIRLLEFQVDLDESFRVVCL